VRRLLALALLVGACAPIRADDVVFCLQSIDGGKPIRMSLTIIVTPEGRFSRVGAVLYSGQPDSLPIVFKSSEAVEDFENRSSVFLTTWLEVLPDEERIGGRYSFRHQGAVLFDFQYRNLRTGKTYHFEENRDVLDQFNSCQWPE
jgi:hypothetical protein